MVSSVCLRLLLWIILLSSIQSVMNEDVDSNTLYKIKDFFYNNYFTGGQYAVAINVPKHQCRSGFDPREKPFLTDDPSATVKPFIRYDSTDVYKGSELIATGVDKDVHSEQLLMSPRDNSPLTYLMNKNKDGCVVFYTFISPCINICLRDKIIPGLDELKAYQGIKAFVFTVIYTKDKEDPELGPGLKKIADRVPLYRCYPKYCILCGKPGSTEVNKKCVTD